VHNAAAQKMAVNERWDCLLWRLAFLRVKSVRDFDENIWSPSNAFVLFITANAHGRPELSIAFSSNGYPASIEICFRWGA